MWQRWSWIVFVLVGGLGVAMSVQMLLSPAMFVELMASVGPARPEALGGADVAPFLAFMGRWTATGLVGVNAITVLIACTALRRRERWAACAMMYWPAMFAAHFLMYESGPMRVVQVVWFVLSVSAITSALRSGPALVVP